MLSLIDNVERPDRKEFIKHLRENGFSLKEYCIKYYARKDLLTGEDIDYKDDIHYINSYFNSRDNMVKHFLTDNKLEDIKKTILGRAAIKFLKFAPSTVETRTSIIPSPALLSKIGIDYNSLNESLGLKPRYDYKSVIEKVAEPLHILVDTREQNPLQLSCRTSVAKLDVGDYSCQNHFNNCFIERKSLEDFCGTMSQGFDRFKLEIERAQSLGFHLAVLVEEKLETIMQINVANSHKFVKGSPEFYLARMRSLCESYDNVQFLFVGGRYESSKILQELFRIKGGFSRLDLQFLYDKKWF